MKIKNEASSVIYFLIVFSAFFLFRNNINFYIYFFLIFISNQLSKHTKFSKKITTVFITFLFFQIISQINLKQSLYTIQLIILSHSRFAIFGSTLLFFSLIYFIYQGKIELNFIYPENLDAYSIKNLKSKKQYYSSLYIESRKKLNRKNIYSLVRDIPQHGYLNYTNHNSLSEEYFNASKKFISKENSLYLVFSNTGSPASEIISLFTHQEFNHLSLSFDYSLHTLLSYNGGNNSYHPGLNPENLSNLNQKYDSEILVYSLKVNKKDRLKILNKIKKINREGSAYNVTGLITKVTPRPNMMYCSQFIYQMLEEVKLNFFELSQEHIKPTDFIDYDFEGKLSFEYKIKFSEKYN